MFTMTIKSNEYKIFALFHVFILQTYALLVTFNGFPVSEKESRFKKDFVHSQNLS